jgi:hypothetical protein
MNSKNNAFYSKHYECIIKSALLKVLSRCFKRLQIGV